MLNALNKSHRLSLSLHLAIETITLNLLNICHGAPNTSVSHNTCAHLFVLQSEAERSHNFPNQHTTTEPEINSDVLIFNAGIIPDFILSFSAED